MILFDIILPGEVVFVRPLESQISIKDWWRIKSRENSFARRIFPPVPVSDVDLDRAIYTTEPKDS